MSWPDPYELQQALHDAEQADQDPEASPSITTPEYHLSDDEVEGMFVEYSTRGPGDWVISGPLGAHGGGPGRRFTTIKQATQWAREKYGARLRGRIPEATNFGGNRWAFLIKGDE